MSQIKWQDLLNILTLKDSDCGSLKRVKDEKYDAKFRVCLRANKSYLEEWMSEQLKSNHCKSKSKSTELRLAGNKIYQKGDDFGALKLYNESVAAAPPDTAEFALSLANRSAALGRLNYYKEAVEDINVALQCVDSNKIPRSKLLTRKALFLHKLNLYTDVLLVIKTLYPTEDQIRNQENIDLKNAYFDALEASKNPVNVHLPVPEQQLPLPKGGENKKFKSASTHVYMKHSKEKGRCVLANKGLDTADIIFVEKPFALVVLPDQYKSHCHHCCKEVVAFTPCCECTTAMFCSESCRDSAWTLYHQWECRGLVLCHCIGIAHLGLRVALLADDSDRYRQVCDLVSHIDDMKAEDIYQYTITAVLLTLYLEKYTTYFKSNPSLDVDKVGSRILRHIVQLICNGHAITKIDSSILEKGCSKTLSEAKVRIATAIYPSASMMNHSCDQNIMNSFQNEYLIVRASRPIKKGEEVFNCYGPHYINMSRNERQQILRSQYFFTCNCRRCQKPENDIHGQRISALRCGYCAGPVKEGEANCSDCRRPQFLTQMVEMALTAQEAFHTGQKYMSQGNTKKAVICLEESVELSSKCLYKHNSDLRTYKDTLARAYTELGRYDEAVAIIEECIESIEHQYGCQSVEITRELLKQFDLLTLDLKRLMEKKKQNSEEFRNKNSKLKRVLLKTKKIIEGNSDSSYLKKIPGMSEALKSVEVQCSL